MANKTVMVASGTGPYRAAVAGDTLVDGDGNPIGTGTADRTLIFSDDTQFAESGTSYVAKKTFRVVSDAGKPVASFRIVVGIWHDTATSVECELYVGTDHLGTALTSTATAEEILTGTVTFTGADDTTYTCEVQIKRTGGSGNVYVKYTDIYAIFA